MSEKNGPSSRKAHCFYCEGGSNLLVAVTVVAAVVVSMFVAMVAAMFVAMISIVVVVSTALFIAVKLIMPIGMISFMTTARGIGAMVAVVGIVVIIHIAMKAVRSSEPGASANKDTAGKPFRTIVAIGSAIVGGVIVIAVGANRGRTNANRDLGFCR